MDFPKASIIILDYKKSRRVSENVESIFAQDTTVPFEVIVVDNSCDPANAAKLEGLKKRYDVKVFINSENQGYTRGNQQGVLQSRGELIFIVNPDIVWRDPHTLQRLADHMDRHPEIGVLGPRQLNDSDGSVAMTVRAFPTFGLQVARRTWVRHVPIIRNWVAYDEMRHLDYTKTQPVDWIQSSFWVTRRALWDQLGGLDTRYRIFMSDPDFCHKVWQTGHEVVYFAEATVHADGRRASAGGLLDFFTKPILRQHVKDALKYQFVYWLKPNPRVRHFNLKIEGRK